MIFTNIPDEIIDLLDDQGNVIGPISRAELMASASRNFRLVSALLRRPDGNFILFRRSYTKKAFPGVFASVGGCVQSGETFQQAMARELYEEVGLHLHEYPWRLLGYTKPFEDDTIGYVALYEIQYDGIIQDNTDDFCESRIFSFSQVMQLCNQKHEVTHNVPIYFSKFYNTRP
jgi:8-oxo-dGTP pyrophosphatase MutT (NUDIX family)